MGWSERRIDAYHHGDNATWLERRMLDHAHPVHLAIILMTTVLFVYGLWAHNIPALVISIALAILGHVYTWTH